MTTWELMVTAGMGLDIIAAYRRVDNVEFSTTIYIVVCITNVCFG